MTDFHERYIAARRAVIARDLKRLNPMQRRAAMTTEDLLRAFHAQGVENDRILFSAEME